MENVSLQKICVILNCTRFYTLFPIVGITIHCLCESTESHWGTSFYASSGWQRLLYLSLPWIAVWQWRVAHGSLLPLQLQLWILRCHCHPFAHQHHRGFPLNEYHHANTHSYSTHKALWVFYSAVWLTIWMGHFSRFCKPMQEVRAILTYPCMVEITADTVAD